MKIRTRLTLQFASIFAFILILFSLTVYFYTAFTRRIAFFDSLRTRANVVAHVYLDADHANEAAYRRILRKYYQTLPEEIVQVFNLAGKRVFLEGANPIAIDPAMLSRLTRQNDMEWASGRRQFTGIVYRDPQKGKFLVVASSVDLVTLNKLDDLLTILTVGFFGAMLIVVASGWAFSKQALEPILKVVGEVENISASDLHRRLSQADGTDEVSHLAQTFNRMLDRLEGAFDMQKTFISNASHELRTPLTSIIGELEVALLSPREAREYERVLKSILDEARLLARLSNGMLQIAQASFDISKIELVPLRFDELVFQASEEANKRQPHAKIEIEFTSMPEDESKLTCKGNESLLLIALINVFENACKFSGSGQKVIGTLTTTDHKVILKVKDEGRGIQADDLKNVFVPFWRADNVRDISGHGIGLPLAEKIIKLHKGNIAVNSKLAVGTEVSITLPALNEILILF